MPQIGPAEILVILLVGLLVFGPHRLPEIGRQVGKGMRELRKIQDTVKGELDQVLNLNDTDEPTVLPAKSTPAASLPAPADGTESPSGGSATDPARPGARAPSRFRPPGSSASA